MLYLETMNADGGALNLFLSNNWRSDATSRITPFRKRHDTFGVDGLHAPTRCMLLIGMKW